MEHSFHAGRFDEASRLDHAMTAARNTDDEILVVTDFTVSPLVQIGAQTALSDGGRSWPPFAGKLYRQLCRDLLPIGRSDYDYDYDYDYDNS